MSVTITPSSSSNKILIRYCLSVFTNGTYWSMRLLRGSDSTIFIGDQNSSATSQSRGTFGSYMPSYVDGRNVTQELLVLQTQRLQQLINYKHILHILLLTSLVSILLQRMIITVT